MQGSACFGLPVYVDASLDQQPAGRSTRRNRERERIRTGKFKSIIKEDRGKVK